MTLITGTALNRRRCTTTTQNTGSYAVDGAVNGSFGDFTSLGNGAIVPYVCTDNSGAYEVGIGTITVSGPSTTLSRSVIQSSNSNNPVSWGAGTKDLFICHPESVMVLTNRSATFESGAVLSLNGNNLQLSPDNNYKLGADNTTVWLMADLQTSAGAQLTVTEGGLFTAEHRDNGASASPGLRLLRHSASPAASDQLAPLLLGGRDSAGNLQDYVRLRGVIADPTNGSEDGEAYIGVPIAGAMTDIVKLDGSYVTIPSGRSLLVGKSAQSVTTSGSEINPSGVAAFHATGQAALHIGRNNDGNIMHVYVNGSAVGTVEAASGTVTWGPFTGVHRSAWGTGHEPDKDPPLGALLCAVDEAYAGPDGMLGHLPCVRLSSKAKDKAVYGVFGGWVDCEVDLPNESIAEIQKNRRRWQHTYEVEPIRVSDRDIKRMEAAGEPIRPASSRVKFRRMSVWSLGSAPVGVLVRGPVEVGDYIMTSDDLGVGILAPEGTDTRYVVAKACGAVPEGVTQLVRATLHAG